MQRRLDVAELAVVVEDAFHFALVAMQFEIAVVADTSYVVAALVYVDAAIAAVDVATAAPAYAGAGYAFGDASVIRREADYLVRQERYLGDRQRQPEVCNWHRRWGWMDVRWGLMCVIPCDPYRCSETLTCNLPSHPYFRAPVDADNRSHSACRSDCTGETSDKAYPVDLPRFHNDGRILPDVTNSDHRDH